MPATFSDVEHPDRTTAAPSPSLNHPQPIHTPRCLSCGYDLSGLPETGVCPECAAPIERSLRGNLLRFASPAYLKTLRTGATLALVASILYTFDWIPRLALGALLLWLRVDLTEALGAAFNISALAAMLFGWWMLSTPDPAFIGADDSRDWRVRLRWLLPFAATVILCNAIARFVFAGPLATSITLGSGRGSLSLSYAELLTWLSRVLHALVIFAGLKYISSLALRVPSVKLRKGAIDAATMIGILITLLVLMIIFGIGGRIVGFLYVVVGTLGLSAVIVLLLWIFHYFTVLGRLRADLSRSLAVAESIALADLARNQLAPADSIHPPPITQSGSDAS